MDEFNLVTVQQVKDYCSIKGDGITAGDATTIDAALQQLINRSSSFLLECLSRPYLFVKDSVETRNGNGTCVLFTKVRPINSVTSVSIDGISIPARTTPQGFGFTFDEDCIYLFGYSFTSGIQNVVITLNSGISTTSRKALIAQQCILELINIKWQRRKHPGSVVEKAGNMINIQYTVDDIDKSIREMIEKLVDHVPPE